MEYTNRKGQRYFLYEGRTKNGKPKYFASRKETSDRGVPLEDLPADYEIAEHPSSAVVSIRKVQPTRITDAEVKFLQAAAAEFTGYESVNVERRGDVLTIYTPDRDAQAIDSVFTQLLGSSPRGQLADWTRQNMSYTAMLRFTLVDEERRIYSAERYCFRGSIDGWIHLFRRGTLRALAELLFPKLRSEEFFELM